MGANLLFRRYTHTMKTQPPPEVPGTTEAERFSNAVSKAFSVSKEEMQRREAEWQKTQAAGKPAKRQ